MVDYITVIKANKLYRFNELTFKAQQNAIKVYNEFVCPESILNEDDTPFILIEDWEQTYNSKGEFVG